MLACFAIYSGYFWSFEDLVPARPAVINRSLRSFQIVGGSVCEWTSFYAGKSNCDDTHNRPTSTWRPISVCTLVKVTSQLFVIAVLRGKTAYCLNFKTPFTRCNRSSNRLNNRLDNWLNVCLHDMQPVVQPVVSCKRAVIGEVLSRYSNKIESVGLRKCPHYNQLAKKVTSR